MEVTTTALAGVLIVRPKVFADARGFFLESFNQREFDAAVGAPVMFAQDNHSRSAHGVLRGLHMQVAPHAQGKLIRVTSGRIFDVAVDVRAGSATYGKWVGLELDDISHRQLWIPPGLAHGFLVMSESADVQYKTTDYYTPAVEVGIRWDDPALAIAWPALDVPFNLSAKDQAAPRLDAAMPNR
ncbi:MAG: dTDP-4-dehydrorhamnose 3,5-epimerase [Pseudomonadota bacterium]|nr:dTDP-4-dehydrorhamnose 3,5-epimerase [Pseudomonadota bacterium]